MDLNSNPRLRAPAAMARHLLRTLALAACFALGLAAVGPALGRRKGARRAGRRTGRRIGRRTDRHTGRRRAESRRGH